MELRNSPKEADEEFKGLEKNVSQALLTVKKINYSSLFTPPHRWPVVIAILLHVFQSLTGFLTLGTFMGIVLEKANSAIGTNITSLLTTVANMILVASTTKLPTLYSRRTLIKWSSQIIIIGHVALGFYLLLREKGSPLASLFTLVPFFSFAAYGIGFNLGWGPIPWMFIGDGLPIKIRGDVASLITAVNWGVNFVVSKTFSWGANYFGYSWLVCLYGFFTFIAMLIMQEHLPETFGFTSDQIDAYYKESYYSKSNKKIN